MLQYAINCYIMSLSICEAKLLYVLIPILLNLRPIPILVPVMHWYRVPVWCITIT